MYMWEERNKVYDGNIYIYKGDGCMRKKKEKEKGQAATRVQVALKKEKERIALKEFKKSHIHLLDLQEY